MSLGIHAEMMLGLIIYGVDYYIMQLGLNPLFQIVKQLQDTICLFIIANIFASIRDASTDGVRYD
jgi:hypothetical protein